MPLNGGLGFGFGAGFGGWGGWGGWGGGFGWNNPFFTLINYSSPNFSGGSASLSNLNAARNRNFNNANNVNFLPKPGAANPSSSRSFGSLMRTVFAPASNGYAGSTYSRPSRSFGNSGSGMGSTAPSSSAGGFSGGFGSAGSSASGGRGGRGN